MSTLLIVIVCLAVISVAIIIVSRFYIAIKDKKLSDKINTIPAYVKNSNFEQTNTDDEYVFIDIPTELNRCFYGEIISASQKNNFVEHFGPYFQEAYSLYIKLEAFGLTPSDNISSIVEDFRSIDDLVKHHNEEVVNNILKLNEDFFDHCLQYPLDSQQRRSIVCEENNCLVVSSAGSGKTSSIVGKVKYLTEIKGISPQRILLISYTNKAASELTERIATDGLTGYTFHKLAIDIIARETRVKPSICDNSDALFQEIYHDLLGSSDFKKSILECFVEQTKEETEWEQRIRDRQEQLSEQKKLRLKALFPDMDGNVIYVRSEQEQKICFALHLHGIKYRYEEAYEYPLADEKHSQYCPDFSIYYEKDGLTKRIYLEHFGVDENHLVPTWFANDKNITYEEANRIYNDGITWKRAAHEKFETVLLETSSADFYGADIKDKLREILNSAGVPIYERTYSELYDSVLPKDSKQEKVIIRLIVTFITLLKSSCKSLSEVLINANNAKDERGASIIKNIIQPVLVRYEKALKDRNQIDFTDIILKATQICRTKHPVEYDYIIVDEFQDISIDRYNFLNVLREGNPPAKLYCVGDDWQSIYRFSGSDMALFSRFPEYFGATEIHKIETTYRFGEPLVSLSSHFIQQNSAQIHKEICPFNSTVSTALEFYSYMKSDYCNVVEQLVYSIPHDKSIFLLGRYSFDDYYLSFKFRSIKEGNRFYYEIAGRKIEFLTVHKSKGLEADYVILLQCNNDIYGFPSFVSDDPVLGYVLSKNERFPYSEERRLFYVGITRAKVKTMVLYDKRLPSVFVDEFLHPEKAPESEHGINRNANKRWTRKADALLLQLHNEGKSIRYIANKMGRSSTAIIMRLGKLQTTK